MTAVVAGGMRRSNRTNAAIVSLTIAALLAFVLAELPSALAGAPEHLADFFAADEGRARGLLHASALMFVAYTGHGRIATLGEKFRDPERSIPKAIALTLHVTLPL